MVSDVLDQEKLEVFAVCLEGNPLNWFQWRETRHPIGSWLEFKQELIRRFHDPQQGKSYETLMALKQGQIQLVPLLQNVPAQFLPQGLIEAINTERLAEEEAAMIELGLYYRCDEKFGPNHRSSRPSIPFSQISR